MRLVLDRTDKDAHVTPVFCRSATAGRTSPGPGPSALIFHFRCFRQNAVRTGVTAAKSACDAGRRLSATGRRLVCDLCTESSNCDPNATTCRRTRRGSSCRRKSARTAQQPRLTGTSSATDTQPLFRAGWSRQQHSKTALERTRMRRRPLASTVASRPGPGRS